MKPEPLGFEVIVTEDSDNTKFAVTVPDPLTVAEVEADNRLPIVTDPVTAQDVNLKPELAIADNGTTLPASYHRVPEGLIVPISSVLAEKITRY
jgi:hypothetical protein